MMMARIAVVALALLAAACNNHVQHSSGTAYLARYADPAPAAGPAAAAAPRTDPLVRAAASVAPDLRLPARFGLARIVNGRLTAIPEAEGRLWLETADRHRALGEFVLISPLIAEFTAAAVGGAADDGRRRTDVVQMIRPGAARQHVDAVLIYEVGVRSSSRSTWLSLADLTIVGGAFLPTRSLTVDGRAEALLLDVRNAYPYGTASAVADLSMLHTSWGSNLRQEQMQNEAVLQVVSKLVPEVEEMMAGLVMRLAVQRPRG